VLWHCSLGGRKGIRPVKQMGGWRRWALLSLDGVAPSRMVGVSASVNLPQQHKVQKFSSGSSSPSRKRAIKRLWWWWYYYQNVKHKHSNYKHVKLKETAITKIINGDKQCMYTTVATIQYNSPYSQPFEAEKRIMCNFRAGLCSQSPHKCTHTLKVLLTDLFSTAVCS